MEKDNKKVIISTVIAVAFLTILIVGATFAYFQSSNSASGSTKVTAKAVKAGIVTITNPTPNLYLKLTASEMQQKNVGYSYQASNVDNGFPTYISYYEGKNTYYNTFPLTEVIVTDEPVGYNFEYNCSFKVNITKPTGIKAGDMSLVFYKYYNDVTEKDDGTEVLNIDGVALSQKVIDLYSAKTSYTFSGDLNGIARLQANFVLNNSDSVQDYLSGIDLSTTITLSDLSCTNEIVSEATYWEQDVENLEPGVYDSSGTLIASWETLKSNEKISDTSIGSLGTYTNGTLVVPDGVTTISNGYTSGDALMTSELATVILPTSITTIGSNAFDDTIMTVYYKGTAAEWNAITKGENWTTRENIKIIYNYGSESALGCAISGTGVFDTNCQQIATWDTLISNGKIGSDGISCGSCDIWDFGGTYTGHIVVIPEGYTSINDGVSYAGFSAAILPTSITYIESGNFTNDMTIYYRGTEEEWNNISGVSSIPDTVTIIYNYN